MKITHFGQPVRESRLERIRNAKGSNQYATKKKVRKDHTFQTLVIGLSFIGLVILGNEGIKSAVHLLENRGIEKAYAEQSIISPVVEASPTPTPTLSPKQVKEQGEIEDYIRTIFRGDARVAIAVSHNECSPRHPLYPYCDKTITSKEYSVGIFQINIQSEAGKVHYDRVPGSNLEEKVAWLREPKNNTLVAFWIFKHSGWNPWTAYTSGNYLKDM